MKQNTYIAKIDELISLFEEIDNLVESYPFFEKDRPKDAIDPSHKIAILQKRTSELVGELDSIINKYGNRFTEFGSYGKVDMFRKSTTIMGHIDSGILRHALTELNIIKGKIGNSPSTTKKQSSIINNKVFIVHGHNKEITLGVELLLNKLELKSIIIANETNKGKTIIEKIEEYSNVSFAIVLMTYDDLGKQKDSETLSPRARQNVILELGYFMGKLGREKVCALYSEGVEVPSDYHGVLYIQIDKNGTWKYRLVKELREAGFTIDANKII